VKGFLSINKDSMTELSLFTAHDLMRYSCICKYIFNTCVISEKRSSLYALISLLETRYIEREKEKPNPNVSYTRYRMFTLKFCATANIKWIKKLVKA
jgi:hypothetical protein